MGGPQWLLELREKTARMPIVLPLSAIGRSHLGNPGLARLEESPGEYRFMEVK